MRQPNDVVRFATVPLSTDLRLHYAQRGDPTGEAIVFLHAYADSWYWFSRVLPLLSPSYRALVPDQRGHGDSDKPECCYTTDDLAADIDAFMEAVGVEKAALVGHSSGGLVAQRVALSYPRRVSRLVLIGAPTTLLEVLEGKEVKVRNFSDPDEAKAAIRHSMELYDEHFASSVHTTRDEE